MRDAHRPCCIYNHEDSTVKAVSSCLPYQCCQTEGSVLCHPTLSRSKRQTRFRRYNTERPVLFKMRLEHKKARHRQLSVFIRQLQELKHVKSLRQIALKDLRQIILKATPKAERR